MKRARPWRFPFSGRRSVIECQPFVKDAHAAELLVALFQQVVHGQVAEVADVAEQVLLERRGHLARVAVGSAERFLDDGIDDSQIEEVAGSQLQRLGSQWPGLL